MSTLSLNEPELPLAADDFNALEQRVLRMVSILQTERDARMAAEQRAAALQQQLDDQSAGVNRNQAELEVLQQERESVRNRVERLLKQLDDITA